MGIDINKLHYIPPALLDLAEKIKSERSEDHRQTYIGRMIVIKQFVDEVLLASNVYPKSRDENNALTFKRK